MVFAMLCLRVFQHQQQVVAAIKRAEQVTMQELNAIIGVRRSDFSCSLR